MAWFLVMFLMTVSLTCGSNKSDINMTVDELKSLFIKPAYGQRNVEYIIPINAEVHINSTDTAQNINSLVISLTPRHTSHSIYLNTLLNMSHLQELWITHEQINMCHVFGAGIYFSNLEKNLSLRKIHINVRIVPPTEQNILMFIRAAKDLEVLDLGSSWIWHPSISGQLLTSLSTNKLKAISLNQIFALYSSRTAERFLNLTSLLYPVMSHPIQYLDISYNNLPSLSGALSYILPNLKYLDVSCNKFNSEADRYDINTAFTLMDAAFIHPKIEYLNASKQSFISERQLCPDTTTSERTKRSLDKLNFLRDCSQRYKTSMNDLVNMSVNQSCKFIKQCLTDEYPELQDFANTYPCYLMPTVRHVIGWISYSCAFHIKIPVAPNLKVIDLSAYGNYFQNQFHDHIDSFQACFQKNSLRKIYLQNDIQSLKSHTLNYCTILGLENITTIDLKNSHVNIQINFTFMRSFPNVTHINLSKNYVNFTNTNCLHDFFPKLTYFDISFNSLSHNDIPVFLFKDSYIEELKLEGNYLREINIDLSMTVHLRFVNLSLNRMENFGTSTLESLKRRNNNQTLYIDLTNNNLICGCKQNEIETIDLIKNSEIYRVKFISRDSYVCSTDSGIQNLHDVNVVKLQNKCHPSHTKIIALTTGMNIFMFGLFASFYVIYKFRYRIYTTYFNSKWLCKKRNEITRYTYDAFISYSAEDRFWVHNTLVQTLEDEYGFKLCIHYRDFRVGEDIADEIVRTITISRCFIAVLSNSFIESQWCDYELKVAHEQSLRTKKDIYVIKLDKLNLSDASWLVKHMVDSRVFIEWPDLRISSSLQPSKSKINTNKDLRDKRNLFWSKLRNKLYEKPMTGPGCFGRWCSKGYAELLDESSGNDIVETEITSLNTG